MNEILERELLLTRLSEDIQLLIERRAPKSIKEIAKAFIESHPRPENHNDMLPFPNPFVEWYYGQDSDYAWCRSVPEIRGVYYDFNMTTDYDHDSLQDPYRPAYVSSIFESKYIPKWKPKPTQEFPEKIIGIDPEQMARLLEELKHI